MKKTLARNPSYSVDEQGNVYNKKGKLLSPKKNWDGCERIQLRSNLRVSKNGIFTFKGHTFHVFGGKYGDTRCE